MACRWSDAPTKSANFAHVKRQEGSYSLPGGRLAQARQQGGPIPSALLTVLKELRQLVLDSVEHGAHGVPKDQLLFFFGEVVEVQNRVEQAYSLLNLSVIEAHHALHARRQLTGEPAQQLFTRPSCLGSGGSRAA